VAGRSIPLPELVRDIANDFELRDGRFMMSDERRDAHRVRLLAITSTSQKRELLVSLVALGVRLTYEEPQATVEAVASLAELADCLVGGASRVQSLFGLAGSVGE
jgi:hypothetical protein